MDVRSRRGGARWAGLGGHWLQTPHSRRTRTGQVQDRSRTLQDTPGHSRTGPWGWDGLRGSDLRGPRNRVTEAHEGRGGGVLYTVTNNYCIAIRLYLVESDGKKIVCDSTNNFVVGYSSKMLISPFHQMKWNRD